MARKPISVNNLMETISKLTNATIEASTSKTLTDIIVYNIDDLVREEAQIIKELERVRSLIVKAKTAGVEPSEDVADIKADNESK